MIRLTSSAAPVAALTAALSVVAVLAAGCSSGGDDAPEPDAPSSTTAVAKPPSGERDTTTKTAIRTVVGGTLSKAEKAQLRTKITKVVDAWFDAAYLGGDYPRTDFDDAFGAFTEGARVRAREDRKLMSNYSVGVTTYDVYALSRKVDIDVLARGDKADAVTAQFKLGMARIGETGAERDERIFGRLFLTREPGSGWAIFGYEVDRETI